MPSASRFKMPRLRYLYDLMLGLALRGGGAVASFVVTWLIARQFGAGVVGQYQIGLTTATLGALFSTLGLHLVLVREAGKLLNAKTFGHLAATYRACRKYVLAASMTAAVVVISATGLLTGTVLKDSSAVTFIVIFAPLIVLIAWLRLNSELLRSIGEVWRSQSLEGVFYSGLTAIALAVLWVADIHYPAPVIALIYLASVALALFLSARIIASRLKVWGEGDAHIGKTDGLIAIAPAVIMSLVDWTVLLLVGLFLSIPDAGIYRTVVMYGNLIQMVTTSFAIMAGPHLAKSRAQHDRQQFFSALNSASYLGVALALPLVLAAAFGSEFILGLFGPEFFRGSHALWILALAQLVGVAAGPAAPAMIMLNREKPVLFIEIITSVCTIPLSLILVQHMGLTGPPIAILAANTLRAVYTRWALARAWRAE